MDLFATLIITIPALFVVGVTVEWLFMRRLADRDRTAMSILVTYAVAILIEGIITQIFGVSYVQLHASYVDKSIHIFGFYLPYIYLYGFALAIVLLGLLYALIYLTRFGQSLRAALQDRRAAELIGIDVDRVRTITFGIGIAVTGGRRHGLRRHELLQPEQRLRPHLAAAHDRHPRRPRLDRRALWPPRSSCSCSRTSSPSPGRRSGRPSCSSRCWWSC